MSQLKVNTAILYELLHEEITGFVKSRVSNDEDAKDLVQEVFVRVHKGLDGVKDEARIRAWVYQVARNVIIDHYRKNGKEAELSELNNEVVNRESSSEERNLNDVVIEWFPTVIAALPEKYSQAVELYELKGQAQQEIATELGLSLSGAKSRIQRGRDLIRQMLFECCSFEKDGEGNITDYSRNPGGKCRWDSCE